VIGPAPPSSFPARGGAVHFRQRVIASLQFAALDPLSQLSPDLILTIKARVAVTWILEEFQDLRESSSCTFPGNRKLLRNDAARRTLGLSAAGTAPPDVPTQSCLPVCIRTLSRVSKRETPTGLVRSALTSSSESPGKCRWDSDMALVSIALGHPA